METEVRWEEAAHNATSLVIQVPNPVLASSLTLTVAFEGSLCRFLHAILPAFYLNRRFAIHSVASLLLVLSALS
jgi:hypothetical protein